MADKYVTHKPDLSDVIVEAFDIVANDNFGSTFAQPTRSLWVGSAGNVRVRLISSMVSGNGVYVKSNSNNTVVFGGVPAGTMLPVRVDMVFATGTTANGLVGCF
jgi:hypothetical protein